MRAPRLGNESARPGESIPDRKDGAAAQASVFARVLVVPLLPFVLAWDGLRLLWTRGLPAAGRFVRRVFTQAAQPLLFCGRGVRALGRVIAAAAQVIGLASRKAARLVLARIRWPFTAVWAGIWAGLRPFLSRIGVAARTGLHGLRSLGSGLGYFCVSLLARVLHPARAVARGIMRVVQLSGSGIAAAFLRLSLVARAVGLGVRGLGRVLQALLGRAVVPVRAGFRALLQALRWMGALATRAIRRAFQPLRAVAAAMRPALRLLGHALGVVIAHLAQLARWVGRASARVAHRVALLVRVALAPVGRAAAACGRALRRAIAAAGQAMAFVLLAGRRATVATMQALSEAARGLAAAGRVLTAWLKRVADAVMLGVRMARRALKRSVSAAARPLLRLLRLAQAWLRGVVLATRRALQAAASPVIVLNEGVRRAAAQAIGVMGRVGRSVHQATAVQVAVCWRSVASGTSSVRGVLGTIRVSAATSISDLRRSLRAALRRDETGRPSQ